MTYIDKRAAISWMSPTNPPGPNWLACWDPSDGKYTEPGMWRVLMIDGETLYIIVHTCDDLGAAIDAVKAMRPANYPYYAFETEEMDNDDNGGV